MPRKLRDCLSIKPLPRVVLRQTITPCCPPPNHYPVLSSAKPLPRVVLRQTITPCCPPPNHYPVLSSAKPLPRVVLRQTITPCCPPPNHYPVLSSAKPLPRVVLRQTITPCCPPPNQYPMLSSAKPLPHVLRQTNFAEKTYRDCCLTFSCNYYTYTWWLFLFSQGQEKKRTFDDFFNFCSFVLAYEEQLVRERERVCLFSTVNYVFVYM